MKECIKYEITLYPIWFCILLLLCAIPYNDTLGHNRCLVNMLRSNRAITHQNSPMTSFQDSIKGIVYIDLDATGTFDVSKDYGFRGVPVDLMLGCNSNIIFDSTTTDKNGNYFFANKPMSCENKKNRKFSNMMFKAVQIFFIFGLNINFNISCQSNIKKKALDLKNLKSQNVKHVQYSDTIQGFVYFDVNKNGSYDTLDVGYKNAKVNLIENCQGIKNVIASATTDDRGRYFFYQVKTGQYRVEALNLPQKTYFTSSSICCAIIDSTSQYLGKCNFGFYPSIINPNSYTFDNFCENSRQHPICDLNEIGEYGFSRMPTELGYWFGIPFCQGHFNNTSFFSFVAGSGDYKIQFTIFDCNGEGLQYGLMDHCNPDLGYIFCNSDPYKGTISIDGSSLEPCKIYTFWLDGYGGDVCSYYINVIGNYQKCQIPSISDITVSPDCILPICPKNLALPFSVSIEDRLVEINSINNLELQWDVYFNNTLYISALLNIEEYGPMIYVPIPLQGEYEICVSTWRNCESFGPKYCKKFHLANLTPITKTIKLKPSDFPWSGAFNADGSPSLDPYGNQWKWQSGSIQLKQVEAKGSGVFN